MVSSVKTQKSGKSLTGQAVMTGKQILIVEDEKPIRDMIAFGLRRAGYQVSEAEDCTEARAQIADNRPDLLLVDWMLPDMSGLELTRQLKRDKDTQEVPIIMLTARADESDKITGLEGGADDYVTKPFSPRELVARINAVLRRTVPGGADEMVRAEGLTLDQASHRVMAGERAVALGPTEYRLLSFFMTHPERVYSRGQLLDRVWGGNVYVEERTVDVHIRRLRKALESFGYDRYVQTVRGA
jgi:two-component system phosphate regulon response regulator PhoB